MSPYYFIGIFYMDFEKIDQNVSETVNFRVPTYKIVISYFVWGKLNVSLIIVQGDKLEITIEKLNHGKQFFRPLDITKRILF